MTDELTMKKIQADKNAEENRKPYMAVWSKSGSYQVYPVRDKVPEQYQVIYRTEKATKPKLKLPTMKCEKVSIQQYCTSLQKQIESRKAI